MSNISQLTNTQLIDYVDAGGLDASEELVHRLKQSITISPESNYIPNDRRKEFISIYLNILDLPSDVGCISYIEDRIGKQILSIDVAKLSAHYYQQLANQ